MSVPEDQFDPYLKWLGIRQADQPPNLYRLLGLELFEADPDVITNAADARTAHLKSFQAGRYSRLSQKLLNEVAAAKVCLLNPGRKAEYDEALRRELAPPQPPPAPPSKTTGPIPQPPSPPALREISPGIGSLEQRATTSSSVPPPLPARGAATEESREGDSAGSDLTGAEPAGPSPTIWQTSIGVAIVTALLVAAVGYFAVQYRGKQLARNTASDTESVGPRSQPITTTRQASERGGSGGARSSGESEATKPTSKQRLPAAEPPPASDDATEKPTPPVGPSEDDETGAFDSDTPPRENSRLPVEESETPGPSVESPFDEDPDPVAGNDPGEPSPTDAMQGESEEDPGREDSDASLPGERAADDQAELADRKLPVPEERRLRKARELIDEIFGDDIRAADSPAQRLALAERLFEQARETHDDEAARYELFRLASDLAVKAGFPRQALQIVDQLAEEYEADVVGLKTEVLAETAKSARGDDSTTAEFDIPQLALGLANEAIRNGQFEPARRLAKMAVPGARRQRNTELLRRAVEMEREIGRLERQFDDYQQALTDLERTPDDPAANLIVGHWYGTVQDDWDRAMPFLARGAEEPLAQAARRELARPSDAAEQLALGDTWWELAEKEENRAAAALKQRAGYWYERTLPFLARSERAQVQKRLAAIAAAQSAADTAGAVRPGNVALASRGARVDGPYGDDEHLIDGNTTDFSRYSGVARGQWPCEWTLTLDRVYRLREIRLLLYDRGSSYARYGLSVSPDGEQFTPVADYSRGKAFGWQRIQFTARPVKAIRLHGLFSKSSRYFRAVELEAYCIPPDGPGR